MTRMDATWKFSQGRLLSGGPDQNSVFSRRGGFTLMELCTVILIISILLVLIMPAIGLYRGRSERLNCTTNLRSLYVAVSGYTTDNQKWPQIKTYRQHQLQAEAWHAVLKPYGIDWINWVCPSVQRQAGAPDFKDPKKHRLDYFATPFDDKPRTPWRWATQPWFIERGDVHGNGNLMIFRDGSIEDMRSAGRRVSMQGGTLD
jgi:prepilin-type N-terminal cleavage/methylation domain-containing protein